MNRQVTALLLWVFLGTTGNALAQEAPQPAKPEPQHHWLQQFVGQWTTNMKSTMPNQPPMDCDGTLSARLLGGFWVVCDMKADMTGTPMSGVLTIGYDPATQKYVGTWIDSMNSFMWSYSGSVDESGKTLTLEAEGPNFVTNQGTAKYRDVYEFKSPTEMSISSKMLDDSGQWTTFMTGTAKRTP